MRRCVLALESALVSFAQHGSCVQIVTMCRPKALNALNLEMIQAMLAAYRGFHQQPPRSLVVLLKGGPRAFCSGGDVVAVARNDPPGAGKTYFYHEYQLDYAIMTLQQPHVALWDGIVFGGGAGISVHASHRVATESTLFAMPETALGLFPDVGGSWFLPRLKHEGLGKFLALTGTRLRGADVVHAGIGTHFIPKMFLSDAEAKLCEVSHPTQVDDVLDRYATPFHQLPAFSLATQMESIKSHFGNHAQSIEQIVQSLQNDESAWAMDVMEALSRMSPTSLKLSLALNLFGARATDPREVFRVEYLASQRCMATRDFYSGVRAVIIDKTGNPKWDPPTLPQVTQEMVEAHFRPASSDSVQWDPTSPFPADKL